MSHRKKPPFARLEWNKRPLSTVKPAVLKPYSMVVPSEAPLSGEHNFDSGSHLLLGDNLEIMTSLLSHLEGGIDLIYCDPPFLSGKAYAARVGKGEDSRRPKEWELASGYRDTWRDGAEYLDMLYHRLNIMYRLLSECGTLYLHLDWHASAYARVILDEIFGPDRLINEIVWLYHGPSPIKTAFKRKHDTILVYTKTRHYIFNADAVRVPYNPSTVKTFQSSAKAGFGKKPDLDRGKVPEDWWYFPVVARLHNERTGYPTQKPEALLDRIVKASSSEDSIVADFFCGSGTTAVAAQNNGRRWTACDRSQLAIFTSYQRLLKKDLLPFTLWKADEFSLSESILPLEVDLQQDERKITVELQVPEVDGIFCQTVEVDWDYNGEIFHTADLQAPSKEPQPSAGSSLRFHHSYTESGSRAIAFRMLDSRGRPALATRLINID